ncbi:hypothetical protein KIN20_010211 [Parelaphostrongylus tenuis]|uniref:Uncharacterized protein n=1 Tax=Parelaphostrongylus tenuis TaxID=148309 RepID=A0AAD5QNY4_PARTN|nr:hypothetical protein KIN20_010211 [Parelaphostrongylus tenuis]
MTHEHTEVKKASVYVLAVRCSRRRFSKPNTGCYTSEPVVRVLNRDATAADRFPTEFAPEETAAMRRHKHWLESQE